MSDRDDVAPLSLKDRWASSISGHRPKPPSMRIFGLVILCGFGLLAFLSYLGWARTRSTWRLDLAVLLAVVGSAVFLWSVVSPRTLPPVYRAWMQLGQSIGAVVSTVLLGLTYFAVAAPVGLVMRLSGNDPLERSASGESYWKQRTWQSDSDSYQHMS
jgi:hypothetical protein